MDVINDTSHNELLTEEQIQNEKNDISNIFSRDLTNNNTKENHRRTIVNEKKKQNETVNTFLFKNVPKPPQQHIINSRNIKKKWNY